MEKGEINKIIVCFILGNSIQSHGCSQEANAKIEAVQKEKGKEK